MKIRSGFVSNSSSSSFLIGTNSDEFTTLMEKSFPIIFEGKTEQSIKFIENLASDVAYDLCDEITLFKNIGEAEFYLREDCWLDDEGMQEEINKFKELFENWDFVYKLCVKDGGEGGTQLTSALRSSFPHYFKNSQLEIKYWD